MAAEHPFDLVRIRRLERGWSQADLATRAGISRAAVSAIEAGRLVPSVAAAIGVAKALGCTVEELFSQGGADEAPAAEAWAWEGTRPAARFWRAQVGERTWRYPIESLAQGMVPQDGGVAGQPTGEAERWAERTVAIASCDPAAGLLARLYEQTTGYRLLVFPRSSSEALRLLRAGRVHAAGVHLSADIRTEGNLGAAREIVGESARLWRVASWEEGVALGRGVRAASARSLLRGAVKWVGREVGSGARRCQDEFWGDRPPPRRVALDHRGVAEALRAGWADAGVCPRLVAEEAGLGFLSVRREAYDLCVDASVERDPRMVALRRVLRSETYRRWLSELPGYDVQSLGEEA